jgi:pimeloyl-ACP methyl ester carboxylesterase
MPFAHVRDISLYYEVLGASGSPIVLINGYNTTKADWDPSHLRRMAASHRVVVFDNRGVGQTDKPTEPYTMQGFAADVVGLLDVLSVEMAHVIGLSMGGMIAQHVALEFPERVLGLVLGCTAAGEPGALYPINPSGDVLELLLAPSSGDRAKDNRDAWPILYSHHFIQRNRDYLEARLRDVLNYPEAPPYALMLQMEAMLNTHDTLGRLADVRQPTLVQTGTEDVLVPPGNSRILADRIPNARLIEYPGAAHGYFDEVGSKAVDDILAFLASIDAGTWSSEQWPNP